MAVSPLKGPVVNEDVFFFPDLGGPWWGTKVSSERQPFQQVFEQFFGPEAPAKGQ